MMQAHKALAVQEVPVGAVIILDGQVIGSGFNRRESAHNPLAHAELDAILNASQNLGSWRLENAELYVTLEPCPMCLAAAQQARIKKLIFGAWDSKGGALSLGYRMHQDPRLHHVLEVQAIPTPSCSEILKQFFKTLRNR